MNTSDSQSAAPVNGVGCGALLGGITRKQWIARVAELIGPDTGPDESAKSYAALMAEHYWDEAIADGCEPESPDDAVWDEMQAGS